MNNKYLPKFKLEIGDKVNCHEQGWLEVKKIEDKLYGTESGEATLPMPDEILTLIAG